MLKRKRSFKNLYVEFFIGGLFFFIIGFFVFKIWFVIELSDLFCGNLMFLFYVIKNGIFKYLNNFFVM